MKRERVTDIASYSTIKYGSSGNAVKTLQEYLNNNGYSLEVDGKFGSKTQAAVKDYQSKKGLTVDGIVGKNTWGALTASSSATASSKKTSSSSSASSVLLTTPRPTYEKSAAVTSAEEKLKEWENSAPDEYSSKYSEEIENILSEILNREQFSYNMNADPLYEQYRELYTQNGKKAMMDTVGQASALTGGYANSYATTAGSQAYQDYLNGLNSVALDLRDRAYEMYRDEGDELIEDITLLRSLDGDDYEKYLDELERYYKDGDYLLEKLTSMSDAEYEQFLASVSAWESDRDYAFSQYTDALDREEFDEEMAFKKAEAERDQKNADRDYALAVRKAASSASESDEDDDDDDDGETVSYPKTYKEFCSRTGFSGIMTESEYYSRTEVSKKYGTYEKYLKAMYKKYK